MKKFFILFFLIVNYAWADVVFDPYLGLPFGTVTLEDSTKANVNGFGIGGRLYYEFQSFFAGGKLNFHANSSSTPDKSYEKNQLGLLAGISFPFAPIRAWMSFFILDQMNVSEDDKEYKGRGHGFGLGYSPLPLLSLNFEYLSSAYDKVDTPTTVLNLSNEATISTVFVSMSFLFRSDVF